MVFDTYADDSQAIIRFDPRTKFLVLLSACLITFGAAGEVPLMLLCALECILIFLNGKRFVGIKLMLMSALMESLNVLVASMPSVSAGMASLVMAVYALYRLFFPILAAFTLLVRTTRVSQILAAFQAMHMPMVVVIPLTVMFRFVPTVQEEWMGVRKAMAFRGIELTPTAIIRAPFQTIEYILIPLLFSTVAVMEELAAASLARGLDCNVARTTLADVKMRFSDYLVLAILVCLVVWVSIELP